jgi:hypothetical protein
LNQTGIAVFDFILFVAMLFSDLPSLLGWYYKGLTTLLHSPSDALPALDPEASPIGLSASGYAGYAFSLIRIFLSALFLFSYVIQPLQNWVSTLWPRIVESDKPVFALLLGGIAAVAKGLKEIISCF